jgi:hypothetical protein
LRHNNSGQSPDKVSPTGRVVVSPMNLVFNNQ